MSSLSSRSGGSAAQQQHVTGPYTLVNLLSNISLSEDEYADVRITCVEFWSQSSSNTAMQDFVPPCR